MSCAPGAGSRLLRVFYASSTGSQSPSNSPRAFFAPALYPVHAAAVGALPRDPAVQAEQHPLQDERAEDAAIFLLRFIFPGAQVERFLRPRSRGAAVVVWADPAGLFRPADPASHHYRSEASSARETADLPPRLRLCLPRLPEEASSDTASPLLSTIAPLRASI